MGYFRPDSLDAALAALTDRPLTILAGGTDHYPARVGANGAGAPDEDILDVTGLAALRGVSESAAGFRIGALTTWTELIEQPLPPLFDGLKLAAAEVGGRQIQNRGTIAGNICNASPAADGVPPLLAMDAEIELTSGDGVQTLPLGDFVTGNRTTLRRTDQLVTAIIIPRPDGDVRSSFVKLGSRRYLVISIVMAAGTLEIIEDRRVGKARLAVGACSAVACRLPALEAALVGVPADASIADVPAPAHIAHLAPIDDIRATATYRYDAALTVLRRCLEQMAQEQIAGQS